MVFERRNWVCVFKLGLATGRYNAPLLHASTELSMALRSGMAHCCKVTFLAASDKTFRDRLQVFPSSSDVGGFLFGNCVIDGGLGNDCKEIREFLNDLIRRRNEVIVMRPL